MSGIEEKEFKFHLWAMLQEGLVWTDKDGNYHLTDKANKLKKRGKLGEYIRSYKEKYQKILDEYEGEGFPEVDVPK